MATFGCPDPGALLAAVRDFGEPCGPRELVQAGWRSTVPYFNAGVLLLDLQQLEAREGDVRRILQCHAAALRFQDQDVLNLLCAGTRWVQLDLEWNAQGLGSYAVFRTVAERGRPALLSPGELARLEAGPKVVHFTGPPLVLPSDYLNPHVRPAVNITGLLCHVRTYPPHKHALQNTAHWEFPWSFERLG